MDNGQNNNNNGSGSESPLKGQKTAIDNGKNPPAMSGIKASRNTGEKSSGSAYLRANQNGQDNSMKSN